MIRQQRGAALLIVLMLLALMSALAAEMTLRFQAQLARTNHINDKLQSRYDLALAEEIALTHLAQDAKDNARQTTARQYWAQPQTLTLNETSSISWQMHDAQRCFNLNALAEAPVDTLATPPYSVQVFTALLINLGIERAVIDQLVQAIADYIDADDSPRFNGAEDAYYQTRQPPQRSAGQPLFLPDELRLIRGMTPEIYQRLSPWICVLPTNQFAININALTIHDIPLMQALFLNTITESDALQLLRKQPKEGWVSTEAFLYWAQQDFSAVKPLASEVKKHLFPYSRFFVLDVHRLHDDRSQGWQSKVYYSSKQQRAQVYLRSLPLD